MQGVKCQYLDGQTACALLLSLFLMKPLQSYVWDSRTVCAIEVVQIDTQAESLLPW